MKEIRINLHGTQLPVAHGDWVDLYTKECVQLKKGEFKIISLGVSMELPAGYYALVAPRSSTPKNHKIFMANSIGIIDNAYNGDDDVWGFPAYAFEDTIIPAGTRIAQFTLVKQSEPIVFNVVESLGNSNRGGFGSTGK